MFAENSNKYGFFRNAASFVRTQLKTQDLILHSVQIWQLQFTFQQKYDEKSTSEVVFAHYLAHR